MKYVMVLLSDTNFVVSSSMAERVNDGMETISECDLSDNHR
jgi:hypothetical protein